MSSVFDDFYILAHEWEIGCLQMKKALQQAFKVVITGSQVWVNFASRMSKSAVAEVRLYSIYFLPRTLHDPRLNLRNLCNTRYYRRLKIEPLELAIINDTFHVILTVYHILVMQCVKI